MASTEGAMICCIRSVASIPPDLRQTDRASETRCKKPEEQNKKVGQWPTRMRAGKARFGGTTGSYGITEGNIAKLRHVARIFHNPLPAIACRQQLPGPFGSEVPLPAREGRQGGGSHAPVRHPRAAFAGSGGRRVCGPLPQPSARSA